MPRWSMSPTMTMCHSVERHKATSLQRPALLSCFLCYLTDGVSEVMFIKIRHDLPVHLRVDAIAYGDSHPVTSHHLVHEPPNHESVGPIHCFTAENHGDSSRLRFDAELQSDGQAWAKVIRDTDDVYRPPRLSTSQMLLHVESNLGQERPWSSRTLIQSQQRPQEPNDLNNHTIIDHRDVGVTRMFLRFEFFEWSPRVPLTLDFSRKRFVS